MKRIVTFLIMAGGCLMWHASLYAQHAYSLDECIGEALRNNVRIKNADNDLAAAQEARKSAFTNYFPSSVPPEVVSSPTKGFYKWKWHRVRIFQW